MSKILVPPTLSIVTSENTPVTSSPAPGNSFIKPQPYAELGGELGLTLHEVALSLGITFKDAKRKFELSTEYPMGRKLSATVNAGARGMTNVESYVLTVRQAKKFVGRYQNAIGDAYLDYLLDCEEGIETLRKNPLAHFAEASVEQLTVIQNMLGALMQSKQETLRAVEIQKRQAGFLTTSQTRNGVLTKQNKALTAKIEQRERALSFTQFFAFIRYTNPVSTHTRCAIRQALESVGVVGEQVIGVTGYKEWVFKKSDLEDNLYRINDILSQVKKK